MPAELVTCIAGESEENRGQREQLTKQLDVLMKGSDTCKRFIGIRLLDADDGTIQSGLQSNDDSANHESSDSDEAYDDSLQEDVRSLTNRSVGRRSLPSEGFETLSTEEVPATEVSAMPEPHTIESPKDEWGFSHKNSKESKKFKKSKISAKRALFE